nr:MAG TPA: hypothetical protein [Caudoviricetes sp.]
MIPLNEVYFGKTNEVLCIEDLLMKLKKKYAKDQPLKDYKTFKTMVKDPILKTIEKQIGEAFGFNGVILTINPDPTINAYTIPFVLDRMSDKAYDTNDKEHELDNLKNYVSITSRGAKFDKKRFPVNLLVCLNLGAIFTSYITIPELMSFILHEIGHTFSKAILDRNTKYGKVDEKFADQFAAMYGYSSELASAFTKLGPQEYKITKTLKQVPIVNILVGIGKIMDDLSMRSNIYDPHPSNRKRVIYQIEQIEHELKNTKDLDPKIRKELEEQLEICKQQLDKFDTPTEDDTVADKMLKYYNRNLTKYHAGEKDTDEVIGKYGSTDLINQRLEVLMRRRKKK